MGCPHAAIHLLACHELWSSCYHHAPRIAALFPPPLMPVQRPRSTGSKTRSLEQCARHSVTQLSHLLGPRCRAMSRCGLLWPESPGVGGNGFSGSSGPKTSAVSAGSTSCLMRELRGAIERTCYLPIIKLLRPRFEWIVARHRGRDGHTDAHATTMSLIKQSCCMR